jgi:hypothetical protein
VADATLLRLALVKDDLNTKGSCRRSHNVFKNSAVGIMTLSSSITQGPAIRKKGSLPDKV